MNILEPQKMLKEVDSIEKIKSKLRLNGKHKMDVSKLLDTLDVSRINHIASMFAMGKCVYKANSYVRHKIEETIKTNENPIDEDESLIDFVWMMTAMYHDAGYYFEQNKNHCWDSVQERKNYLKN